MELHNSELSTGIDGWVFILLFLVIYIVVILSGKSLNRYLLGNPVFLRLPKQYKSSLEKYFPFYNALDDKKKRLFERRVQRFIYSKQFIPRSGLGPVTPEMKAMIAGSAIQLTWGYPHVYFRHFRRILIYPNNYYSTITRKYHKGEVNFRGLIVISWKDFMDGFSDHTDGINLGFHEMAHALRLINIVANEEFDFYDRRVMDDFDRESQAEIDRIEKNPGINTLFRGYSITNKEEFFAVSVELFFEQSCLLKKHNLKLYNILEKIFKVDPEKVCRGNQQRLRA